MSVLKELVDGAVADAHQRSLTVPLTHVRDQADAQAAARSITKVWAAAAHDVHLIAEVKRASPSKGDLAQISDPAELARQYATAGASMISVLTEERRFAGSLTDLQTVTATVEVPVLRKDFLVNEYQLLEARAAGADVVLLIVAALSPNHLSDLLGITADLGMTALVEAHTVAEVDTAVAVGAEVIGINARNLHTLQVDPNAFTELAPAVPKDRYLVAESGIISGAQVQAAGHSGAHAVLVGEGLVTHNSPQHAAETLINAGKTARRTD